MRRAERGYALISVIVAFSLVLLTLLVASTYVQLGSRVLTLQLNYQGQALNVAQAGLVEALDWFRRQTQQPVTTFNPTRNLAAVPPVDDTDVVTTPPSIRRDYLISATGNVWGHYEVNAGNAAAGTGVLDISKNRRGSSIAAGSIWQLESIGVVYVRNTSNMSVAYNQSPNQVLATKTVRSEITKMAIQLPDSAAVSIPVSGATSARLGAGGNQVRIIGGPSGRGLSYANGAPPFVATGATLSGTPPSSNGAGSFTIANVFGVSSLGDLTSIADINVNSETALPATLPPMQLIVINKGTGQTVTFGPNNPLNGSGVLVVVGNLTIDSGPAPSMFNGIIYVTGNFTQDQPSTINGSVVVAGNQAGVDGSGSFSEIYFDPFIVNQVQQQLRQYRFSRSGYVPCPSWDTNCNSKFAGS